MELLRDNIPLVSLAVFAAVLYARTVSSLVRPGPWRLATLLPVVVFFVAVPLAFSSSIIIRFGAGLYLAWIGTFKVVLLALGCGPLDLSLPILRFLFAAALPVELIESGDPDEARYRDKSASLAASFTLRVAGIAAIVHLYRYLNQLHLYVRILLHGIHMMFTMELVFTCITGAAHVLGMEVKPHFIRPYLATSLRDFWGRRWNLPVSAILRASVYNPMRARAGKEAGILATFLVSGLMHEALVYYLTLQLPTGEMTAYFLIHGVCRVAEECLGAPVDGEGMAASPKACGHCSCEGISYGHIL